MLEQITKEELDIYNYVSDKLDDIINNEGLKKINSYIKGYDNNDNGYNNISIYILMGILIIMVIIFLVISRFYYNPNKSSEHIDNKNKEDCLKIGGFCYRTL